MDNADNVVDNADNLLDNADNVVDNADNLMDNGDNLMFLFYCGRIILNALYLTKRCLTYSVI